MKKKLLQPLITSINKWIRSGEPMKSNINFNLTIRAIDFNLLPQRPELVKQLRKLTLHSYSGLNREMNLLFELINHRPIKAQVLLAINGDRLVGWALLSKERSSMVFTNTWEHFKPEDGTLFELYVDPKFRRQGIGTELIKVARRKAKPYRLCVAPWDSQSRAFYDNFKTYGNKVL